MRYHGLCDVVSRDEILPSVVVDGEDRLVLHSLFLLLLVGSSAVAVFDVQRLGFIIAWNHWALLVRTCGVLGGSEVYRVTEDHPGLALRHNFLP